MFLKMRSRITYANVAVTVALVFAMTGGAFAAGHYLITSTRQISPKVLKQLKGANGKAGANGAAGPAGPGGPAGTAGSVGKEGPAGKGETGPEGKEGKAGESVTVAAVPTKEATCKQLGGAKFTAGGKEATACNGKEGSPWTAGGTLPSEQTETGTWSVSVPSCSGSCSGVETNHPFTMLSFPIPLPRPPAGQEAAFDESHVVYVGLLELFLGTESTQTKEHCPSTIATKIGEEPLFEAKAAPGYLCVYESNEGTGGSAQGLQMEGNKAKATIEIPTRLNSAIRGAGAEGAVLSFTSEGTGEHHAAGVWAVTAE